MVKLYCIPGLGADYRVFEQITCAEKIVLDWVEPKKRESLDDYALRLRDQIDTKQEYYLLGLSLGGMLAQRMLLYLDVPPKKLFLISTLKDIKELPPLYRLGLHKIIPFQYLRPPLWLAKIFFGTRSKNEGRILKAILVDTDLIFLGWATNALFKFKPVQTEIPTVRIHGDKDVLIPYTKDPSTVTIKNSGHFMVLTHGRKVNKIILEAIND